MAFFSKLMDAAARRLAGPLGIDQLRCDVDRALTIRDEIEAINETRQMALRNAALIHRTAVSALELLHTGKETEAKKVLHALAKMDI